MKTKQKQLSVIVGIWLTVILSIVMLTKASINNLSSVDELGNSLEELRSTLYFDTQYRIKHADDISLKIQLIYSLRLQLESSYEDSYFQPDINQFIFTSDRFIELVKQFNDTEVEVIELVDRLKTVRDSYQHQPEIQALYYQLSTRVFEAMFSQSSASPEIYRSLDYLFVQSQDMSPEDGEKLQQALAQTSSVLGGYAKGNYLVEKLVNHPINRLQSELRQQYDELAKRYFMIVILVSALAMFLLSLILMRKMNTVLAYDALANVALDDHESSNSLEEKSITSGNARVNIIDSHTNEAKKSASSGIAPFSDKVSYSEDPIDEQKVSHSSVLSKAGGSHETQLEQGTVANESDVFAESKVDIEYMLQSLNDDKESVVLLLDVFIQDHEDDAQQLPGLLESDMEHAMRKAHSLKGVAANLGAEPLKEISTLIEADIKNETTVDDQKLKQLLVALSSTIESAKRYIESQK